MTSGPPNWVEPSPLAKRWQRWRGWIVLLIVLLVAGFAIWQLAGSQVGVRRSAPRIATITPLPPPPPPPKEKPPEPKKQEVQQELPRPNSPAKPIEAPKQAPDTAKQVTINGPAQAGNDAFNIGAGEGGGMVGANGGTGVGGASYDQYLGYAIQQAVQRDERINRLAFEVRVDIWMDTDGRLTRAQLVNSTGSEKTDAALADALRAMPAVDVPPPASTHFPLRVLIRGRRPG